MSGLVPVMGAHWRTAGTRPPTATLTSACTDPAADADLASDRRLAALRFGEATLIVAAQILALLPGISRSGVTMVAGLSHEDAARFSFLLATPVILTTLTLFAGRRLPHRAAQNKISPPSDMR
jgi:undecaprenyl pyrophosphate phosphatase UppP